MRPADQAVQQVTVLIIGAGIAGIATAVNMRRRGIEDFVVLEMSAGPGGTWWDSRYPGAEVDTSSDLYCYSFAPHVFSRTHAGAEELRDYLGRVIKANRLAARFHFGQKVDSVEWDQEAAGYTVRTRAGATWRSRYVVSCVGQLNNPGYPAWAADSPFAGEIMHTARWNERVSLAGKTVAVIGTGSTSAQIVPEAAEVAAHLYVFQRQPGWVIPKLDRTYTAAERRRLESSAWRLRLRRRRTYWAYERMLASARYGTRANRKAQRMAEAYLREVIPDPALRAKVTPDYPLWGKRVVMTQYFYPALNLDNVTLVPHAVQRLTGKGIIDATGEETVVDVIILATGFAPSKFLATFTVTGPDQRRLDQVWDDEPRSLLGMMAPGFPDFFVTYGPNTNGGTAIFFAERQAEWIAAAIRDAERRDRIAEARPQLIKLCDKLVMAGNNRFVWARTGNNYYTSRSGRVVTQWPFTMSMYGLLTRTLRPRLACSFRPRR
jgi:cation diffusion facilitator CzcD-associated flavoprotein CzcO